MKYFSGGEPKQNVTPARKDESGKIVEEAKFGDYDNFQADEWIKDLQSIKLQNGNFLCNPSFISVIGKHTCGQELSKKMNNDKGRQCLECVNGKKQSTWSKECQTCSKTDLASISDCFSLALENKKTPEPYVL